MLSNLDKKAIYNDVIREATKRRLRYFFLNHSETLHKQNGEHILYTCQRIIYVPHFDTLSWKAAVDDTYIKTLENALACFKDC